MGLADINVLIPTSPDEAMRDFGDGSDVVVIAGGTIVAPELVDGTLRPKKAVLLGRAGLDQVKREGGKVTIGAATPIAQLEDGDEPLAEAARYVADIEIRGQATLGGNICAPVSPTTPRGDLQAPLIVLGATVRSVGSGGERVEPLEDFLDNSQGRLVLDVSYDDAQRQTGYAATWRPHTHHYTILAVAAARRNGELRVAATGAAPHAVRLTAVEESGDAAQALEGIEPRDDALASAWYRTTVLPRLVEQALSNLS